MNTAVATKMPARGPVASAAGRIGVSQGANSAGLELAKKNSTSGPRSSASLSQGLSVAVFVLGHWLPNCEPVDEPSVIGSPGDGAGEILGREGREIVDALADADEMHRQREFPRDGHENAAARGAVELGHGEAGDARDFVEYLDLRERVLPDGRVEHEQHRVRRGRVELLHHAHDLFELLHQHRLVLQAAGGVDDQHVGVFALRGRERVEGEARRRRRRARAR